MRYTNLPRRCMQWIAIFCVCAAIYVLSIGPSSYLVERSGIGREIGEAAYAPLIWIDGSVLRLEVLAEYERYFTTLAQEADRRT